MSDEWNGISEPNYTQFPNQLLDAIPSFSEAEWKVLSVIVRQTFGWHKDRDAISKSQFVEKTGLSGQGVANALGSLTEHGVVRRIGGATSRSVTSWELVLAACQRSLQDEPTQLVNYVGKILSTTLIHKRKKERSEVEPKSAQPLPGLEPTPLRPAKKREPPHSEQYSALLEGLRYDPAAVKKSRGLNGCLNTAAKELDDLGCGHDVILSICADLRKQLNGNGRSFGAMAVAKWAAMLPLDKTELTEEAKENAERRAAYIRALGGDGD